VAVINSGKRHLFQVSNDYVADNTGKNSMAEKEVKDLL
jgi:hypothetical protein